MQPTGTTHPFAETFRDDQVPYFLWDDPMTSAELREYLGTASKPERLRVLGRILREARDVDVWQFVSLREVLESWTELAPFTGRRRPFWEFLFAEWRRQGAIP